jgi:hypothetical protein
LGYPLFLAFGYLAGGSDYGPYLIIAAQLVFNLLLTWGCWSLLEKLAPEVRTGLRIAATLFFFWAGLGMALNLLSDFLASFFFGVFLYGMLFWRGSLSVFVSGSSLALATLVRPTFTFVPLLLPIAGCLIARVTSRLPRYYVVTCIGLSLAATGVSTWYQYYSFGYLGPSNVVTKNIARTLHYATTDRDMTYEDYQAFKERLAREAGLESRPLSQSEEEEYGKQLMIDELKSRPVTFLLQLTATFVKYIFVPVESLWAKIISLFANYQAYLTYARPLLFLACLPLWILSLAPPRPSLEKRSAYYLLVILFLLYVVGITVINPNQAERIRFPVLPFMLPVILWNACDLWRFLGLHMNRLRSEARTPLID